MRSHHVAAAIFLSAAIHAQACSKDPSTSAEDELTARSGTLPGIEPSSDPSGRRCLRFTPTEGCPPLETRDAGMTGEMDAGMAGDAGAEVDAGTSVAMDAGQQVHAPAVYGWNLDFIYGGGFVFADKMKMARPWVSCSGSTWDDGRALAVDANGWPTSLLAGQEAATLTKVHGGGHYVVTWTGAGSVDVRDHLGFVSQQPNRVVVDTEPEALLQLRIVQVPVHNLQVRREGAPASDVWDPIFVQRLAGAGVVRYMQWGMTNGDEGGVPSTWSERSQPDYFTQNQRFGVAYEHMIALSNDLGVDAWINVPHLADDTYVQNLANMLRDTLDPGLKVYVEWSNEVWNDSFPQALYARQMGAAAGLGGGDSHLARLQYQSRRTRQVFEIFEQVFAGQMNRLVRVVASQEGNDWNDAQLMGFEGLAAHADALAVAPYFGHNAGRQQNAQSVRSGGVSWVLDFMEQSALPQLISEIQMSAASASQWGVPLIAYEGGQHLVAEPSLQNDTSITSVLEAAQRDPRMYDLYRQLLSAWDAAGGSLFVHYTYTGTWNKWGYWGALESNDSALSSDGAHKYRAILDWAATH